MCFSLIVGLLFLEETHEDKKDRLDVGLEIGKWIMRKVRGQREPELSMAAKTGYLEEAVYLLAEESEDEQPPGYRSTEGSPRLTSISTASSLRTPPRANPKPSMRSAFTPQVMLNIIGYGILALYVAPDNWCVSQANICLQPHHLLRATPTGSSQYAQVDRAS